MKVNYIPAVIAASGTTSAAVNVGGDKIEGGGVVAIYIPSGFTGTTLTYLGSHNKSTFKEIIKTDGTALSHTVAADKWLNVPVADLAGYDEFKIVSGATEGSARTLIVAVRPVA